MTEILLEDAEYARRAQVDSVEILEGTTSTSAYSHTIKFVPTFELSGGLEAALRGNLAVVSGEVKTKVEAALKLTFEESQTKTKTLTIDGNKLQKARIVWIDKYRKGSATVSFAGKDHLIPFIFPTGTDVKLEKID